MEQSLSPIESEFKKAESLTGREAGLVGLLAQWMRDEVPSQEMWQDLEHRKYWPTGIESKEFLQASFDGIDDYLVARYGHNISIHKKWTWPQ